MPEKKSNRKKSVKLVNADVVYQEMYEEMRRFRDYELTSSNWYTAILLALAGVILTLKNSNGVAPISGLLFQSDFLKFGLSSLVFILVGSSIFTALYVSSRYEHMREWVNKHLEPTWKNYKPPAKKLRPIHMIVFVQIILAVVVVAALWLI